MIADDAGENLILGYWHEWEIAGRERRVVLCVETCLDLDPEAEGFAAGQLDALTEAVMRLQRESASPIDLVRIIPTEPD